MADRSAVSAVSAPSALRRPDWTERFVDVFSATGNVRLAATAAGVSRDAPYKRAQVSSAFAAQWLQARESAVDILEAEARRRALSTSDTLLMFLLKADRPDRFSPRLEVRLDLRREAERLAVQLDVDVDQVIMEAERILAASQ
jgi:hypothetical protein